MKTGIILVAGLGIAVGCLVVSMYDGRRPVAKPIEPEHSTQAATAAAPESVPQPEPVREPEPPERLAAPEVNRAPTSGPAPKPVKKDQPAEPLPPAEAIQPPPVTPPKEKIQDPLARVAMALVGVDPDAEAYWLEAINDPTLSDNEREDLIEDLNENGYSGREGRRATMDDLPLILRRLEIVEGLWPFAMDENNWNAFREVDKDLWNIYERLTSGPP